MSWSVAAQGKPVAVAQKLQVAFEAITCTEPEQGIKNHVARAVLAALAAYPPGMPVTVSASGSQACPDPGKPDERYNQLSVKIDPIYGFVE